VDSQAACRLWKLTRGNVLYLRHIVEQEVAAGRLEKRHGYWRWIGDPMMPRGLVELIEFRIGTLPTAVGAVIDALAVGEPIELAALRRITDPGAVEEADTRGLITSTTSTPASKCVWRTRSTARCAGNAPHAPGCGGCADWSPPNWPLPRTATTCESWSAAPH